MGLPQRYRHGFWSAPMQRSNGCTVQSTFMSGYGGNMVVMAANGIEGM
ncbi:hypothetical protein [Acanthopleuribacter pedis]|uniref:Uncharacterized protein n=1 Tax=Acanthopleuribacter pedis TaxID=442870 RepID=A0A8J7U6T2_9BACT|nr:hypothetical protein [Acanthopleuribacter pedis]MBO1321748.1 hypothetical protein [Acanthopleuribacter pedis]